MGLCIQGGVEGILAGFELDDRIHGMVADVRDPDTHRAGGCSTDSVSPIASRGSAEVLLIPDHDVHALQGFLGLVHDDAGQTCLRSCVKADDANGDQESDVSHGCSALMNVVARRGPTSGGPGPLAALPAQVLRV